MNDIAPGLPPIDDDDLLAGEYVLGVLDADARREAQRRIGADRDFAARVARWDAHFFGAPPSALTREQVEEDMVAYMEREAAGHGTHWYAVARHMLGADREFFAFVKAPA